MVNMITKERERKCLLFVNQIFSTGQIAHYARIFVQQWRPQSKEGKMFEVHHLRRFLETEYHDRRPVQGRPRSTDRTDDRLLIFGALLGRTTASMRFHVSCWVEVCLKK